MGELISDSSWIANIEDARKGKLRLPEFRSALTDFILVHHPEVPIVEGATKQKSMTDHGVLYDFAYFENPYYSWAMLSHPKLKIFLPVNNGEATAIKLSSSAFPVDNEHIEDICFLFEFPELDLRCRLGTRNRRELSEVTSISRDSEPFTMHTPIGSRVRSWPKWSRAITSTDVDEITNILQRKDLSVMYEDQRVLRSYNRH